jgi:hypothetical protein
VKKILEDINAFVLGEEMCEKGSKDKDELSSDAQTCG